MRISSVLAHVTPFEQRLWCRARVGQGAKRAAHSSLGLTLFSSRSGIVTLVPKKALFTPSPDSTFCKVVPQSLESHKTLAFHAGTA